MESIHKRMRMTRHVGALRALRRRNVADVLAHLRRGTANTRAEIARLTQLDPKTITILTNYLRREKLLLVGGSIPSSGGRPAEQLSLNPDGAYSIGIDLGATRLRTVVLDLTGHVRSCSDVARPATTDPERILAGVVRQIHGNVKKAKLRSWRRVAGIGFACPGFLDRLAGVALEAVNIPGWRNVPVAEVLDKEFRVPVHLEESSRVAALGEGWFGLGQGLGDFVSMNLGYGIGVGIMVNGALHYGASESGGEIGHTTVRPDGEPCFCGNRGCLETVASGEAIARLSKHPTAKQAVAAAQAGDRLAAQVIADAGGYLGVAMANLVNLLNPKLVILDGGLCRAGALLLEPLLQAIREHAVPRSLAATRIEKSPLNAYGGALGAAMIPLQPLFFKEMHDGRETGNPRRSQSRHQQASAVAALQ